MKKLGVVFAVGGVISLLFGFVFIAVALGFNLSSNSLFDDSLTQTHSVNNGYATVGAMLQQTSDNIQVGQTVGFMCSVGYGESYATGGQVVYEWYVDGVLGTRDQNTQLLPDGFTFYGSTVGSHTVVCIVSAYPGGYVAALTFSASVYVGSSATPAPTSSAPTPSPSPSPTLSPYPTPTPVPTLHPTPSPTPTGITIIPTPKTGMDKILMGAFGALLAVAGGFCLWLSRHF